MFVNREGKTDSTKVKSTSELLAVLFGWSFVVGTAPRASADGWPVSLQGTANSVLLTQPNGNVTAGGCGSSGAEQRSFSKTGAMLSALPQGNSGQYYTCANVSAVALTERFSLSRQTTHTTTS